MLSNASDWPEPGHLVGNCQAYRLLFCYRSMKQTPPEGGGALVVRSLSRCRLESAGVRKRACPRTFQVRQASKADDRSYESRRCRAASKRLSRFSNNSQLLIIRARGIRKSLSFSLDSEPTFRWPHGNCC